MLNTSIQTYSLPMGHLLPPSNTHPSPPDVLAISPDGVVLLSASPLPPTILIQDRRWAGIAAVHFKPTDTSSAATCAAFQEHNDTAPSLYTKIVLGFRDGTLAMYKIYISSLTQSNQRPGSLPQLLPSRVGVMSKLHKAAMGGVTAAAFVPGYSSRVVSIGQDGRCRLVDFEGNGQKLRT